MRENHEVFDYLKEEVGYRVYDRVLDIKRHFETVVDLSAGKGYVGRNFTKVCAFRVGAGKGYTYTLADKLCVPRQFKDQRIICASQNITLVIKKFLKIPSLSVPHIVYS